jgi:glycosyltransferase involved in cell wall biosynthesis
MNPLYLLTAPSPVLPGTDAVFQEVQFLKESFGGEILNLYPLQKPSSFFPKSLIGLHKIPQLLKLETDHSFHHLFFAYPHLFPFLACLKKPLIYSVSTGLKKKNVSKLPAIAKKTHTLVVNNERDAHILKSLHIPNFRLIRPGIPTEKFKFHRCGNDMEFVLLMGSAPWTKSQFKQKGIDLLLEAAVQLPFLKLVFLWRGLLRTELEARIQRHNLRERCEIIDRFADVNEVLKDCHAAVVLAEKPEIVKSYPHSLLESLAAGKPVLASHCIAMSDDIAKNRCGPVVHDFSLKSLIQSIHYLIKNYPELQENALKTGQKDYSLENFKTAFAELYQDIGQSC